MTKDSDEIRIRALLSESTEALKAKDVERALAPYADTLVRFDLALPLATIGANALDRASLEEWFATWQGGIGFDLRDLTIAVSGDLAFCHGFVRISGTKVGGTWQEVWARLTLCLRRLGEWRIVHEHTSVPFYMDGSVRAAVDLQP